MTNKRISNLWTISALFMFVAATFQIASDHFILGVIFFASATCGTSLAAIYRKRDKTDKEDGTDE